MRNSDNIAEGLFGNAKKTETGFYAVDPAKIMAPFKNEGSVSRLHCEGCNSVYELSKEALDSLLEKVESSRQMSKGSYLSVDGCVVCQKDRKKIEVRQIIIQ